MPTTTLDELDQRLLQQPDDRWALAHRGDYLTQQGNYDAALHDLTRALALDPEYSWAWARRGETNRLLGRFEQALADFERALTLRPEYPWALAHRGATHEDRRHFAAALSDLNHAIALEPAYAWAIAHRGRTYEQLHRYEEALIDFDHAVALDASLIPDWHTERALLLSFLRRYDEALDFYKQGLNERADDLLARYGIIVVSVQQQGLAALRTSINQLRADLQQAASNEAARGMALYGLAGLAAMEGQSEEALTLLPQAIRLQRIRLETARHDLAWHLLRGDVRFQTIIAEGDPLSQEPR